MNPRPFVVHLYHAVQNYTFKFEGESIMGKLDGKVAVITGGTSGIGLATAQHFVAEGAQVFITGRRQTELDKAVKTIGKNVTGVQGDVAKLADLDRLYATVKQKAGHIDIVFANAGGGEFAPLGSITEEHFDKTFNSNVKGLLFTVQKALPLLVDGGSIILNASIVSSKGFHAFSVYSATKAAVRSFARSWTVDLKDRKIRVNAISPGPIDTPILDGLGGTTEQTQQIKQGLISTVPMGRLGQPDEIAKAAVFLGSDDSSFITGIELFVDGGTAQI
jgi:NAD(P)-dependent dehydrogenase (short-subunit alcohol dehydrogenase family)